MVIPKTFFSVQLVVMMMCVTRFQGRRLCFLSIFLSLPSSVSFQALLSNLNYNNYKNYKNNSNGGGIILSPSPVDRGQDEREDMRNECSVYFAPSTIPGAGSGVFAGKHFAPGDVVTPGDLIVPITDFPFHNNEPKSELQFLWYE